MASKTDHSFSKAVGGKLKLKGVEFKGKKAVVKKDKKEKEADPAEDASAQRVSNQKVFQQQGYYKIVSTPDGQQTVALKSTTREKDLDKRVKTKSDRFCMST